MTVKELRDHLLQLDDKYDNFDIQICHNGEYRGELSISGFDSSQIEIQFASAYQPDDRLLIDISYE